MSFCADCFKGVRHEGATLGKLEVIKGVETYVSIPEGDYPKDKAIIYLADAFGIKFKNTQLLVDDFARNGFATYAPDLFKDDPIPLSAMDQIGSFDVTTWIGKHGREVTRSIINSFIAGLQERGITAYGATGYCFGGRYVFDLAFDNVIKVAVVAHPSLLEKPADLEKYVASSRAPLLINACETDSQFPIEAQKQANDLFGDDKFAPGYKLK